MHHLFNWLITLLSIACLAYILFATTAYLVTDRFAFPAPEASYQNDKNTLKLKLANGEEISACYEKNPQAHFTILFSHGNGEDIGEIQDTLQQL